MRRPRWRLSDLPWAPVPARTASGAPNAIRTRAPQASAAARTGDMLRTQSRAPRTHACHFELAVAAANASAVRRIWPPPRRRRRRRESAAPWEAPPARARLGRPGRREPIDLAVGPTGSTVFRPGRPGGTTYPGVAVSRATGDVAGNAAGNSRAPDRSRPVAPVRDAVWPDQVERPATWAHSSTGSRPPGQAFSTQTETVSTVTDRPARFHEMAPQLEFDEGNVPDARAPPRPVEAAAHDRHGNSASHSSLEGANTVPGQGP